jgi:hypothetical protein
LKVKSVYIKDQSAAVSEGISEYRVLKSDIWTWIVQSKKAFRQRRFF